jgi:uncharacterized lipoprotein YajG
MEFHMNKIESSRKFLIALTLLSATSLVAGCGSDDAQVTRTTTQQSTTTAPVITPTTSTTTTTSTQKSSP